MTVRVEPALHGALIRLPDHKSWRANLARRRARVTAMLPSMRLQDRLAQLDRRVLGGSAPVATSTDARPRTLAFLAWLGLAVATLLLAGAAGRSHDPVLFVVWLLLTPASAVTFTNWWRRAR